MLQGAEYKCVGFSHFMAVRQAMRELQPPPDREANSIARYLWLGQGELGPLLRPDRSIGSALAAASRSLHDGSAHERIEETLFLDAALGSGCGSASFSFICSSGHILIGLVEADIPFDFVLSENPDLPLDHSRQIVSEDVVRERLSKRVRNHVDLLRGLRPPGTENQYEFEAPPPVRDDAFAKMKIPPQLVKDRPDFTITPAFIRHKLWRLNSAIARQTCAEIGITFVPVPSQMVDNGFLADAGQSNDPIHGNIAYGRAVLAQMRAIACQDEGFLDEIGVSPPYRRQRDYAFWRRAIGAIDADSVNPSVNPKFLIRPEDKVATAGSCFAQHLSRQLQASGFNYYVAEQAPPGAPDEQYNVFSARYGNIYTSRQLVQTFDRAFGSFEPVESVWRDKRGGFRDPFRPGVPEKGFDSEGALLADRERHLAAVRTLFKELDVFVFTLGLTECWRSRRDGAAFPIVPGVDGGTFSPVRHEFLNLSVSEVVEDMTAFFARLAGVNPRAKAILTVSPVPLAATALDQHVLTSTTYSKSVLRAAAGEIALAYSNVAYFPSYEIITGAFNRGAYYNEDLRDVTASGVAHVMRAFLSSMTTVLEASSEVVQSPRVSSPEDINEAIVRVYCDEAKLDPG